MKRTDAMLDRNCPLIQTVSQLGAVFSSDTNLP